MPNSIRVHETGGLDKLKWEEVQVGEPTAGQVRVRNKAVGLNFLDTYQRSGLYPMQLPFTPGSEGAGIVEAVGPDIRDLKKGDRVAYAGPVGAYAEVLLRPADRMVKIPEGVDDQTAAAMMLKGLTSQYLIRQIHRVQKGDVILMHAAAGGVGQILCQWANHLGATVIGTVGSDAKAALAAEAGCQHVIVTGREKFSERVKEITKGKGVAVVYDGVGKDTFMESLDCLRPRGMMVSFGNASGPVPLFNPAMLGQKGALFLTRPTLLHYTGSREELVNAANELFAVVGSGKVKIKVNQTYPLRDAARAQADLEARKTTGSTVMIP